MDGNQDTAKEWWAKRQLGYNKRLVISAVTALFAFIIGGIFLKAIGFPDFFVFLFLLLQFGVLALVYVVIANVFYRLGLFIDSRFNITNSPVFRKRLYNVIFWLSFAMPFSIPLMLLIAWMITH